MLEVYSNESIMEDTYRILIPTDYSNAADHALEIGIALANRSSIVAHLLHIADIPPDWVELAENSEASHYLIVKEQLGVIKQQLSDRLLLAKDQGVEIDSFLQYNKGYKAILGHVDNYETDLIVMGAHGRSGLKGMLMGSYTQRVLHNTHVPVLVTELTDLPNNLRKVLFVSDFAPEHAQSLITALDFCKRFRVELEVLFINTAANFRETHDIHKRIDYYLKTLPEGLVEKIDIVNAHLFEEGLARFCEENDIDIIAMPIYSKRQSWSLLGAKIEDVIHHLEIPVLGIPVEN